MSLDTLIEEVERLSRAEQELLLDALQRIVDPKYGELTPEQEADLELRIAEADAHPEQSIPLDEAIEEIEKEFFGESSGPDSSRAA